MLNFNWNGQKEDRWLLFIFLLILVIVLVWKAIIQSWYLLHTVSIIVLFIVCKLVYKKIEKERKDDPAFLWKKYRQKYPIVVQYAPPKWINPAEAWLLYNLKVDPTDLTSLIYQWKFEWLIDIKTFVWESSKKEYVKLIKKQDIPVMRPLFETEIFDTIFVMSDVKVIEESFQLRYALMLEDLEYHWIKKWWVTKSSLWKKWEYVYKFLFVLLFVCVYFILSWKDVMFSSHFRIIFLVLLSSCIFLWWYIYGWWKLKFTDKGASLAAHLIWYRNFIKSCDENKIRLFLKDDPLFIDRTLPYATAFGMETEFLNKISPLKTDRNAKYVRWKKVSSWISVLSIFLGSSDDSLL